MNISKQDMLLFSGCGQITVTVVKIYGKLLHDTTRSVTRESYKTFPCVAEIL